MALGSVEKCVKSGLKSMNAGYKLGVVNCSQCGVG